MNRVTEIRSVAYGAKDLRSEREFYVGKWGLEVVDERDDAVWLKAPGHDEHHVVRLHQADTNTVELIAFAASSRSDVDSLFRRTEAAGARIIHAPKDLDGPGGGYGFRFFSPDGLPFEVSSDVRGGASRTLSHHEGLPVRISHIVLHSPNLKGLADFFVEALGFRVSDWLGDFMCFLRCNSAHHRIAILPGPPCLNHVAYDMTGVDGMMSGIGRLRRVDVPIAWGPGRHTAGNNTFSYFVTPNGFTVEYTADLENVDDETWQPKVYEPAPRTMDQWGYGVGGPQALPHPVPDPGLFRFVEP
jgi:catechol 2,3-dioxygenase-like lactoylglutathione lyase family enzyme